MGGAILARTRQASLTWLIYPILVATVFFRFFNLSWDGGHLFHPDERHILMVTAGLSLPLPPDLGALLQPSSPLNPSSFAYGSFPFYALALTAWLLKTFTPDFLGGDALRAMGHFDLLREVGRPISALFDTGTVLLTYLLGRRLYGNAVGLLGAAFVAFAALHIQLSHFYASDTLLTFFIVLVLLLSWSVARGGGLQASILTGAAVGAALACKVSAFPIVLSVVVAHGLTLFDDRLNPTSLTPHSLDRAIRALLLSGVAAVLVFAVLMPYALLDWSTFIRHISEQNDMVRGVSDLPYTRQFINRPAYWYFVENLAIFGLGPALGVTVWGAFIVWLWRSTRGPTRADLLLLAWLLPYLLITGAFHAKFLRYMLPIVPILCLVAGRELLALRATVGIWAERVMWPANNLGPRLLASAVPLLISVVVLMTFLNGLAYLSIYTRPHTAVAASAWVYENVPPGSRLATEHWEEGLPVEIRVGAEIRTSHIYGYQRNEMRLYEPDDEQKLAHLVEQLRESDYLLFFSNRLYGTIPRLPERYPISTRYYQLLFEEKLGYELVAAFTSYPSLCGLRLVDDTLSDPGLATPRLLRLQESTQTSINLGRADESFSVYDHPKVLIFKKVQQRSASELMALLAPPDGAVGAFGSPNQPGSGGSALLMSADQRSAVERHGTYTALFNRQSWENSFPVVVWVLMLVIVGAAAMPIAVAVFVNLSDRGYLLSRTLGVLLLAWINWMGVSLGVLPNDRLGSVLSLLVLLLIGMGFALPQRHRLVALLRDRRPLLLTGEAIFWSAFIMFLLIRMANPDLWHPARGGEKPMDLAYLMAAIKTPILPPYDPWFAGGYLNYYYFGQAIIAVLIRLSGIVPTVSYNLAVPTLFAMMAAGVFCVVSNLSIFATSGRRQSRLACTPNERQLTEGRSRMLRKPIWTTWHSVLVGLAGTGLVCVAGNLGGAGQLVGQISALSDLQMRSRFPGLEGLVGTASGVWRMVFEGASFAIPVDWYWASTRVIAGTINEFPFFTFLYADLHAHMIALPITALVLALAVDAIKQPSDVRYDGQANTEARLSLVASYPAIRQSYTRLGTVRPGIAWIGVAALSVGSLSATNSWDYPTYVFVLACSLLLPWYLSRERHRRHLLRVGIAAAAVVLLGYVLFLPFHRSFQSFYSGVEPFADKSPVAGYVTIHGLFLYVLISFVGLLLWQEHSRSGVMRWLGLAWRRWERLPRFLSLQHRMLKRKNVGETLLMYAAAGVFLMALLLSVLGMELLGLLFFLLMPTLWLLIRGRRRPEALFSLGLFALGLGLGMACELVAIQGDIGRMNTVFKFYLQVWVLWSVAAAAAIGFMWRGGWLNSRWLGTRIWLAGLAVLVLAVSVYPLVATRARVSDRFDPTIPLTLDGTAYMHRSGLVVRDTTIALLPDLEAIRWLQENITGTPTILEAAVGPQPHVPLYSWGSRVSVYTGLPTVQGWDWHQKQQRWGYREMIDERLRDVWAIYADPDPAQALALLQKYEVRYVYVGALERAFYPASGLAKFDWLVGGDFELVYDRNGVRIYRVSEGER